MKRIFTGIAVLLCMVLTLPIAVTAQEEQVEREASSEREQTREERIAAYKERAVEALSEAESRRVAGVCKAAQTVVLRLQTNLDAVIENRQTRYGAITTKLNEVIAKLQAASVDTAALEALIQQMNTQVDTLVAGMQVYQTTITDLGELDCEADPAAFKAALESARAQRAELVAQSQSIKTFVKESIQSALAELRAAVTSPEPAAESEV